MVDVLAPYAERLHSLTESGTLSARDWLAAADLAREAAAATRDLVPKLGRARPLAEKSLGSPDAGATSVAIIISAVTESLFPDRLSDLRPPSSEALAPPPARAESVQAMPRPLGTQA